MDPLSFGVNNHETTINIIVVNLLAKYGCNRRICCLIRYRIYSEYGLNVMLKYSFLVQAMAFSCLSAAISVSSTPISCKTTSVCSPLVGGLSLMPSR